MPGSWAWLLFHAKLSSEEVADRTVCNEPETLCCYHWESRPRVPMSTQEELPWKL